MVGGQKSSNESKCPKFAWTQIQARFGICPSIVRLNVKRLVMLQVKRRTKLLCRAQRRIISSGHWKWWQPKYSHERQLKMTSQSLNSNRSRVQIQWVRRNFAAILLVWLFSRSPTDCRQQQVSKFTESARNNPKHIFMQFHAFQFVSGKASCPPPKRGIHRKLVKVYGIR